MNKELKTDLIAEAIRIGDDILNRTEKDDHGFSWKTMSTGPNQSIVWSTSESIYSGVSSIVLFFIELYKQTRDERYLEAVKEGARWVEYYCESNPTSYYALFTGRMGAAYMMLQVSTLLKDDEYKKKALIIARNCQQFLEQPRIVDDLINGTSGTLLGLLHLHSHTHDGHLIPAIQQYTKHLIASAHIGSEGLYWDKSSKNIRGLCGFSHGASGVGYVFLELGEYFDNKAFYWIAHQAFAYENSFFDHQSGNWPDFRKGYYDEKTFIEHKNEYLKGNKSFFTTSGNMSAWCHGAPGIGLSRLKAYELLEDNQYKIDVERAISNTCKTTVEPNNLNVSYTVCHGGGGNAMLFLEAYGKLRNENYLKHAEAIGLNGLKFIKKHKKYISGNSNSQEEDYSLFMGNAGIGYFYLQLLEPISTPSIVKPNVENTTSRTELKFELNQIKAIILQRYFPKTLSIKSGFAFDKEESAPSKIIGRLAKNIHLLNDERLSTIFNYERDNLNFQMAVESDSYFEISHIVEVEKNLKFINEAKGDDFLNLPLKMSEFTKLYSTEWDCIDIKNETKDEYYSISTISSNGLKEHKLSDFSHLVFDSFVKPTKGRKVLQELIKIYDATTSENIDYLEISLQEQIKEGLQSGILITVN